ncbi:MAG: cell division protein ZapE [Rhizobiales bacterium]|nr:cell division protein ZapE [Hyphomicrobiales bacterium]
MGAALTQAYDARITGGELDDDAAQRQVVERLEQLAKALDNYAPKAEGGLLDKLFGKPQKIDPPAGVYIHGDVGRGKTMLMDLFFDAVTGTAKRRDHFLSFMQDVHGRIHEVRRLQRSGEIWEDADPIRLVAEQISKDAHLLCFDEFQVNDITDALILGRLFEALFGLGVVVVATSNVRPGDLYKDGLNRNSFLPFIDILATRVDTVSLDSDTDYRLGRLAGKKIYHSPLGAKADKAVQALWLELTEVETGDAHTLTVKGRELVIPQAARGAARFAFADLCEAALGAADYIAIAADYRTVFIEHIPVISPEQRNEAKRFITLIDALYDRGTKLVVSAAAKPDMLYPKGPHQFEFDRTTSRLNEMQSESYFHA